MSFKNHPCIVLGAPVSGVQLSTQLFNACGVDVKHMPYHISAYIDECYKRIDVPAGGLGNAPSMAVLREVFNLDDFMEAVNKDFPDQSKPWGFSDHRLLRFLHLFLAGFDNPLFFLIVRHPSAFAHSMFERYDMPYTDAANLWAQHHEDMTGLAWEPNFVTMRFERILEDALLFPAYIRRHGIIGTGGMPHALPTDADTQCVKLVEPERSLRNGRMSIVPDHVTKTYIHLTGRAVEHF